jgi:hypothetical protein
LMEGFKQLNEAFKNIAEMEVQANYHKQMELMAGVRQEQVNNALELGKEKLQEQTWRTLTTESGKNSRATQSEAGKTERQATSEAGKNQRQDKKLATMLDMQKDAFENHDMNAFAKIQADIYNYQVDKSTAGAAEATRTADKFVKNAGGKGAPSGVTGTTGMRSAVGQESTQVTVPFLGIKIPFTGKAGSNMTYRDLVNAVGSDSRAQQAKNDSDAILGLPDNDPDKNKFIENFHQTYPEIGKTLGF